MDSNMERALKCRETFFNNCLIRCFWRDLGASRQISRLQYACPKSSDSAADHGHIAAPWRHFQLSPTPRCMDAAFGAGGFVSGFPDDPSFAAPDHSHHGCMDRKPLAQHGKTHWLCHLAPQQASRSPCRIVKKEGILEASPVSPWVFDSNGLAVISATPAVNMFQ